MIRKLLATTALATVIATGAYAQDAAKPDQAKVPEAAATADTSATTAAPAAEAQTEQMASAGSYLQNLSADQYLASELSGASLYASEAEDAETVGEIQNFLVGNDGAVVATVVDANVGDVSKTLAVPFDQITWTMDKDNEPRAVLNVSADQLAQAPAFTKPEEQQTEASAEANVAAPAGEATTETAATTGDATQPEVKTEASTETAAATGDAPKPETEAEASTEMAADAQPEAQATATQAASASGTGGEFPTTVGPDQYLSENIIGAGVYSGPGEDAEEIGEINDLVLASSGKIEAGVIGVGGFLGIGEKDVAVPFDQFQMAREADDKDDIRVTLAASKEQLEKAPSFEDERPEQMAATETGAVDATAESEQAAKVEASTEKSAEYTEKLAADAKAKSTEAADKAALETKQAAANVQTATENAAEETQQAAAKVETTTENVAVETKQAADATAGAAAGAVAGVAAGTADATTTASTGGESQQQQMTPVTDQSLLTADNLMGTTVYGPNEDKVGEIGDIALSEEGKVDAIIIDVGGFLGIGEKEVAVAMDNLQFMQDANGSLYLYTQFSEDQLKSQPEYNADTYAESRDTMRLQSGEVPAQSSNTAPAPAEEQPATKTN